ncbi:MAG: chemotaxis protein [Lachnospiraceae bacterium]|nr:chemotaxis protein [Lachnospiraceae bacterium]
MEGYIPADNQLLQDCLDVLPLLYDLFDEDVSFSVCDTEKFLMNRGQGEMVIEHDLGIPVPKGGAAGMALSSGQSQSKVVPKELYGIVFKSYAVPVKDEGVTVGCISLAKSQTAHSKFAETCTALSERLSQIHDVIHEMSDTMQEMLASNEHILEITNKTVAAADSTSEILSFIQNISTQTRLLGLNASIEAARAGESGKGFEVVAQEIEKMSQSTTDSVKKSSGQLATLSNASKNVLKQVKLSNDAFSSQAGRIDEIIQNISELNDSMTRLNELVKDV